MSIFAERAREQILIDLTDMRDLRRAQAAKAKSAKLLMIEADCEAYATEIEVILRWYRNGRNAQAYPVTKRRAVSV